MSEYLALRLEPALKELLKIGRSHDYPQAEVAGDWRDFVAGLYNEQVVSTFSVEFAGNIVVLRLRELPQSDPVVYIGYIPTCTLYRAKEV